MDALANSERQREESSKGCRGAWAVVAILLLIAIVVTTYFVTRWSGGRLVTSEDGHMWGDGLDASQEEIYGYETSSGERRAWLSSCAETSEHCHVCVTWDKHEPLPEGFVVMSTADVWANEADCMEAVECDSSALLSDGKYDGPCLDSKLTAGNYLGCDDIQDMLLMTDDGRAGQHLFFGAPCPDA